MILNHYYRHFDQPEQAITTAKVLSKQAHFRSLRYYIYLDAEGWFFSGARTDESALLSGVLYGYVAGDTFVETDQF